jgi:5'-nucleotidase
MAQRRDSIRTFTNRSMRPLAPKAEDIAIEDVAHALANSCRFTGHVKYFYSVAQHATLCSYLVEHQAMEEKGDFEGLDVEIAFWALHHDDSEAYLSDIARPIKNAAAAFGETYKAVEAQLMEAVKERFLLWPDTPEQVHSVDNTLLVTEARDLMHGTDDWSAEYRPNKMPPLPMKIEPWLPELNRTLFAQVVITEGLIWAKDRYLRRHYELEALRG